MKYGFTLPGRGQLAAPGRLGIIARKGEELGFDSVWAGDHVFMKELWTQQDPSFDGRFHSSSGMKFSPKPDPTYP